MARDGNQGNTLSYFAMLGGIIMDASSMVQPIFFYFIYVLLCLQAANSKTPSRKHFASYVRSEGTIANA